MRVNFGVAAARLPESPVPNLAAAVDDKVRTLGHPLALVRSPSPVQQPNFNLEPIRDVAGLTMVASLVFNFYACAQRASCCVFAPTGFHQPINGRR